MSFDAFPRRFKELKIHLSVCAENLRWSKAIKVIDWHTKRKSQTVNCSSAVDVVTWIKIYFPIQRILPFSPVTDLSGAQLLRIAVAKLSFPFIFPACTTRKFSNFDKVKENNAIERHKIASQYKINFAFFFGSQFHSQQLWSLVGPSCRWSHQITFHQTRSRVPLTIILNNISHLCSWENQQSRCGGVVWVSMTTVELNELQNLNLSTGLAPMWSSYKSSDHFTFYSSLFAPISHHARSLLATCDQRSKLLNFANFIRGQWIEVFFSISSSSRVPCQRSNGHS